MNTFLTQTVDTRNGPRGLLAIDPGTTVSAWLFMTPRPDSMQWDIGEFGIDANKDVLALCRNHRDGLVIEWIEGQGQVVGKETFETCRWIGRFMQAYAHPEEVTMLTRRAEKLHLCNTNSAKDPNIRQALLDIYGPKGTKKEPGATYGISKDVWSALAVATTHLNITPLNYRRRETPSA